MSDRPTIAELYLAAQQSFVALVRSLTDSDWAKPVPCCPGWTVRDVLSHVAGLSDDVLAGRLEGTATDPWTAAQVIRWRDTPTEDLLDQWDAQAPALAELLQAVGEGRPPIDCCTHEHDVRGAIGRPGNRDSVLVAAAAAGLRASAPIPLPADLIDFELFRSRLGRRSVSQVADYAWAEPPTLELLDAWFVFGPTSVDIHE